MARLQMRWRDVDQQRVNRALLAWHSGDEYALGLVLDETQADDFGVNQLLFGLLDTATLFADSLASDSEQVERVLVEALRTVSDGGDAA